MHPGKATTMRYLPLWLLLAACTPLTEQQIAEREFQRGEERAKFLDYKAACEAEGGNVVIRARRRMAHDRMPGPGDRYHCEIP